jgi:hypothetical protein
VEHNISIKQHDYVQLSCNYFLICTHAPTDSEVGFGPEQFAFENGRRTTCKTIKATDDRVSDGTQTSRLVIGVEAGTSVPVEIRPVSIPITIIDNDGEYS